jgi:hypothetical protein
MYIMGAIQKSNSHFSLPESEEFELVGNDRAAGGLVEMLPADMRMHEVHKKTAS